MKVYVVEYDWGSYGNGIKAIFSNKEAAEKFVKGKSTSFGSYSVEEYEVDEEK